MYAILINIADKDRTNDIEADSLGYGPGILERCDNCDGYA